MGKLCCNPVTLSDELCENEYNTLGYMNIEHKIMKSVWKVNTQFYQGSQSLIWNYKESKKETKRALTSRNVVEPCDCSFYFRNGDIFPACYILISTA